jgi:hypothetical protein
MIAVHGVTLMALAIGAAFFLLAWRASRPRRRQESFDTVPDWRKEDWGA